MPSMPVGEGGCGMDETTMSKLEFSHALCVKNKVELNAQGHFYLN